MNGSTRWTMNPGLHVALFTLVLTSAAQPSLVTWEFAGHLTEVNDVAGVLPDTITVGTPFFGSYTFDSETPDTQPDNPLTGVYPAIVEYWVEVAEVTFLGPVGPRSIVVGLASPGLPTQGYGTNVGVEWDGLLADTGISLSARSGTVFQTDELPVQPPALEAFDLTFFDIDSRDKLFFLEGTVTALVPEPATGLLLTIAGLVSGTLMSRRVRCGRGPRRRRRANVVIFVVSASAAHMNVNLPHALAVDCNANGTNDECDLDCNWPRCGTEPSGGVEDCNGNRIPDGCELPTCQEIYLVFIIDVSSSVGMGDPTPNELCVEIADALDALNDPPFGPLTVNAEIVAVGSPDPGRGDEFCDCCCGDMSGCSAQEETAPGKFGGNTCGLQETVGDCSNLEGPVEDWGTATAAVAANKKWGPGPRIVVPISDEGPRCGDPLEDPGADAEVIEHAIPIVSCNRVIVSPVVDTSVPALERIAIDLSDGAVSGGQVLGMNDPSCLSVRLANMIASACPSDCNANGVPDSCDIAGGTSRDCFHHCCAAHGSPGCDDPVVECEVCAEMPDCCTVEWTTACADLAESLGRCGSGDGIPDDCQTDGPDCDSEGTPDTCTINCGPANAPCSGITGCGQSTDCDNDCVPDDCQGFSDCNGNGVRDLCDIANGTSIDCFNGQTDCCIVRETPGCDTQAVQDEVCGTVPSCCDTAWSAECVFWVDVAAPGLCTAGDGVPDDCGGEGIDCNENGISDGCDLNCGPGAGCESPCSRGNGCGAGSGEILSYFSGFRSANSGGCVLL